MPGRPTPCIELRDKHKCMYNDILPKLKEDLKIETISDFSKLHIARYIDAIEYKFELLQTTLQSLGELHDKFCTNSAECNGNREALVDEKADDGSLKEDVNVDDENDERIVKGKRRVGRPSSINGAKTKKKKSN